MEPVLDTSGTNQQAQAIGAVRALKEREDCDSSAAEESLLLASEAIEVAFHDTKQNFVCEIKQLVESKNREVERDRELMLSYIQKRQNSEELSEEDHIKMTEKLMLYRMLRREGGEEYYFAVTRYDPPSEVKRKAREAAQKFVRENGPPSHCFFVEGDRVKKKDLESSACQEAINLKAQAIPYPLVAAQAAGESGWGSSDQASAGNILGIQVRFRHPETMPEYKNCRPAEKDKARCVLQYDMGYKGAIFHYFELWNGAHYMMHQNYRKARLGILERDADICAKSEDLANYIGGYAEDAAYNTKIHTLIRQVCPMLKECESPTTIMAQRRRL